MQFKILQKFQNLLWGNFELKLNIKIIKLKIAEELYEEYILFFGCLSLAHRI